MLNQAKGPPTRSPLAFSGRPVVVSASMAPTPKAATKEPRQMAQSQRLRAAAVWALPRYSKATARKIRPTSTSTSGM